MSAQQLANPRYEISDALQFVNRAVETEEFDIHQLIANPSGSLLNEFHDIFCLHNVDFEKSDLVKNTNRFCLADALFIGNWGLSLKFNAEILGLQ